MIRQTSYTILFLFLSLLSSLMMLAQPGIVVRATVDKNQILIGEPIQLKLEADIPESDAISFFNFDTIPHFEFLDKGKIDTSNTSSGTLLTQVIRITSWDSGHWVIPQFVTGDSIITDSIPIDVGYTPFDRNQDYHDIKDVIDVEPEVEKEWWWWAIGAGTVVLLALIYLLLRKKPVKKIIPEVVIDPYAEAMRQIDQLQQSRPAQKQYYSSMIDIFREYVNRKKGIHSLQKTSDDLLVQLRSLTLSKDNFDKLAQALRLGDFVKFAKYTPGPEDDAAFATAIKKSIQEIEQTN